MKSTPPKSPSLFRGRHFDSSISILRVRWYITYKISYRDLRDMMAERGIDLYSGPVNSVLPQIW